MDKNNYLRITQQGVCLASAVVIACLLAASCNDMTDDGTTLPDGLLSDLIYLFVR